jgi:GMP synthase-like glutamine amidotransferase
MLLIVTSNRSHDANINLNKLYDSLRNKKIPFIISKRCDPNIIKRKDIRGIIIPGSTGKMRISLDSIQTVLDLELYYLFHFPNLPVLGICHGCQFLMVYYGGSLLKYDTYLNGDILTTMDLSVHTLFDSCKSKEKLNFHFHDLPIQNGAHNNNIKEIAWFTFRDNKRRACAFEFERGRVYGVMFHPENNEESHVILYNFYYNLCL